MTFSNWFETLKQGTLQLNKDQHQPSARATTSTEAPPVSAFGTKIWLYQHFHSRSHPQGYSETNNSSWVVVAAVTHKDSDLYYGQQDMGFDTSATLSAQHITKGEREAWR